MLANPSNFILNSDLATLKNSEVGLTATLTVPGNQWPAANATLEWHVDIPIKASYAIASCRISSSLNSNRWIVCNYYEHYRTDGFTTSAGDWIVSYSIYVYVFRVSSTVVRFQAVLPNPTGEVLVTKAGDEVFNLYMNTFVPPFA